ncbi:MAG: hypothetical protein SF123_20560 [Chloroflexota bacterium]|nr:hypothetical protein [Chloroflexota bacterium]
MKKRLVPILALLIVLLGITTGASAQGDLSEEISDSGLTVSYYEEWVADTISDGGIYIASSDNALEVLQEGEGDFDDEDIALGFYPPEFLENFDLDIDESPERTVEALLEALDADGEVSLSDDESVAFAFAENGDLPGGFVGLFAVSFDEGTVVATVQYGDDYDEIPDEVFEIFGTLTYEAGSGNDDDEEDDDRGSGDLDALADDADEVIEGELTNREEIQAYLVELEEGDIISIAVVALDDELDPVVRLFEERDYPDDALAENDDHDPDDIDLGSNFNSLIFEFEIEVSDEYVIEVSSFGGSTGEYELYFIGEESRYDIELLD